MNSSAVSIHSSAFAPPPGLRRRRLRARFGSASEVSMPWRSASSACWKRVHHSPMAGSTSPLSPAQQQKIVRGAKTRMFEQPVRPASGPLQQARLQRPDFLHVGGETPRNGNFLGLHLADLLHRLVEGGDAAHTLGFYVFHAASTSCHSRRQTGRRGYRLVGAHAMSVFLSASITKRLPMAAPVHVEQRQQAVKQSFLRSL